MVTATSKSFETDSAAANCPAHGIDHPHFRQVGRYSTVEQAEATVSRLREEGVDAVLSMIDGLCVIARDLS